MGRIASVVRIDWGSNVAIMCETTMGPIGVVVISIAVALAVSFGISVVTIVFTISIVIAFVIALVSRLRRAAVASGLATV